MTPGGNDGTSPISAESASPPKTESITSAKEKPDQTPSLKERVERNPFIYLITCVVAAVGVSTGIQQYFYAQKNDDFQRKLDDLNVKLASIRRGLPGSEYLEIKGLIYEKTHPTIPIPSSSTYFSDGSFYASTAKDWQYSVSSEAQILKDFSDIDLSQTGFGQASRVIPAYIWRPKAPPIQVENSEFKRIYPYVMLENVTFEQLHQMLGIVGKDEADSISTANEKSPGQSGTNDKDDTSDLEKYIRNDAVGSMFAMKLMMGLLGTSPKQSFTLLDVQKVGNVLYSQTLVALHDVKVGGKEYSSYYLRLELILIAKPNGISLIQTLIPSEDPSFRNSASAAITAWLEDFRVVVS